MGERAGASNSDDTIDEAMPTTVSGEILHCQRFRVPNRQPAHNPS